MRRLRLLLFNLGLRTRQCPMVVPPIGIMSLAAYVRTKFDLDIRLINQRLDNLPVADLVKQAAGFQPDIVGISCITTAAYVLPELTRQLRLGIPNVYIVLGGAHATGVRAEAMEDASLDAVVVGEGELVLEQILAAVSNGSGFDQIPGLIWRDEAAKSGRIPAVFRPLRTWTRCPCRRTI